MGQMIDFKRPDGSACRGYLASAGQGKPVKSVVNPRHVEARDFIRTGHVQHSKPDVARGRRRRAVTAVRKPAIA